MGRAGANPTKAATRRAALRHELRSSAEKQWCDAPAWRTRGGEDVSRHVEDIFSCRDTGYSGSTSRRYPGRDFGELLGYLQHDPESRDFLEKAFMAKCLQCQRLNDMKWGYCCGCGKQLTAFYRRELSAYDLAEEESDLDQEAPPDDYYFFMRQRPKRSSRGRTAGRVARLRRAGETGYREDQRRLREFYSSGLELPDSVVFPLWGLSPLRLGGSGDYGSLLHLRDADQKEGLIAAGEFYFCHAYGDRAAVESVRATDIAGAPEWLKKELAAKLAAKGVDLSACSTVVEVSHRDTKSDILPFASYADAVGWLLDQATQPTLKQHEEARRRREEFLAHQQQQQRQELSPKVVSRYEKLCKLALGSAGSEQQSALSAAEKLESQYPDLRYFRPARYNPRGKKG